MTNIFIITLLLFFFKTPDPLEIHFQVTHPTCAGKCDGTVKVTVTGGQPGYMFFWSNGSRAQNYYDACAGTGELVVKDIAGNIATGAFAVVDPQPISIDKLVTHPPLAGRNDGFIAVEISGGLLPYYFSLDGEKYSTSNEFYNLPPAPYVIYIKDTNGCLVQSSTFVLDENVNNVDLKSVYHFNYRPEKHALHIYSDIEMSMELADLQGRVLKKEELSKSHDISFDDFYYGIYFLRLSDGVQSSYEKIVKSSN